MCVCISAGRQEDVQKRLVKQPIHTTVHVIYDMHINHARITKKKTKQNKTKRNKKACSLYIHPLYSLLPTAVCIVHGVYLYVCFVCVCLYVYKETKKERKLTRWLSGSDR